MTRTDQLASMVAQLYRENNGHETRLLMKRTDLVGISDYENFEEDYFAEEYDPKRAFLRVQRLSICAVSYGKI